MYAKPGDAPNRAERPVGIAELQRMKRDCRRIAMVTAYDAPSAALADRAGLPVLLVGDSLGQVVHGLETTLPVTLDDMIRHAAAVVRGRTRALVVADLPFLTYATPEDALRAAGRLVQEAGVHAVKLEGGQPVVEAVRRLVDFGVPVMGHLGYTPQSTRQLGVKVQGKDAGAARQLLDDALALQAAGAFAIVLELIPAELAAALTARLKIPTIGIGAGEGCDGQVQVWHDIMGLPGDWTPRHAKRYAEVGQIMEAALKAYLEDVRTGAFPTSSNGSRLAADVDLAAALTEDERLNAPASSR